MLCFFRRLKPVFSFLYAVFKDKSVMFSLTLVYLNCCSKSELNGEKVLTGLRDSCRLQVILKSVPSKFGSD